jgi:hypothetical protein
VSDESQKLCEAEATKMTKDGRRRKEETKSQDYGR